MLNQKDVIYLHGFASSAQTSKALALTERSRDNAQIRFWSFDFNPTPADFSHMSITGMINRLRQFILEKDIADCTLVGSSLGGLVALHYTSWFGGVNRLLLLAPALKHSTERQRAQLAGERDFMPVFHYAFDQELPLYRHFAVDARQYRERIAPPIETTIVHGKKDDVVPISGSRSYARKYPEMVMLIEVDSDHRLGDQVDLIWQLIHDITLGK